MLKLITAEGSTQKGEEPQCHTRQVQTEKIENKKKKHKGEGEPWKVSLVASQENAFIEKGE